VEDLWVEGMYQTNLPIRRPTPALEYLKKLKLKNSAVSENAFSMTKPLTLARLIFVPLLQFPQ